MPHKDTKYITMKLTEILKISNLSESTVSEEKISEAAWWLTRWVSGSMNDPDWDDTWTTMSYEEAFKIIGQVVGNRHSATYPALWRALALPKKQAKRLLETNLLPPNPKAKFQSFTSSRQLAEDFAAGSEYFRGIRVPKGSVIVLVSAKPDANQIPFGMADLKQSSQSEIQVALMQIEDWHHQDEVLVKVTTPLPLLSAEII